MRVEGWTLGLVLGLLGLVAVAWLVRYAIGRGRAAALATQLERTAQALEEIIETAPAGFVVFDSTGCIVRINPAMAELVERSATEQVGRHADEVFGAGVGREIKAAIEEVLDSGHAVANRRLTLPVSAEPRSLLATYYPVVLEDVTLVGGVVVDITERERYNRAREQLLESQSEAREIAEQNASRLTRLQAITSALSTAPSSDLVAEVIMAEGMKAMEVDAGSLATITEGLHTLQIVATEGLEAPVLRRMDEIPLDEPVPIADAARTQRGIYLESIDDVARAYPHLVGELERSGHSSWAAFPLVVSGRMLGAIGASFTDSWPFDAERVAFFEAVADQCAAALDRALSYDVTRVLARTLQRSLLPPTLPDLDAIDLAARFESARSGEVSGDFYDAFELPGGSAWCVTIGDVCGKGASAASMTSLARHTIRAAAHHDSRPSAVLTELAEALRRAGAQREDVIDESFCTSVFATVRPRGDGLAVEFCCGGHPLPLLVRHDGIVEECGSPGTLLGVLPESDLFLVDHQVALGAGDALVFYTDGLPDAHGPEGFFGYERLQGAAAAPSGSADELVKGIVDDAIAFSNGILRDDLAVLVVRALPSEAV